MTALPPPADDPVGDATTPFFVAAAGAFVPGEEAVGPWGARTVNGRLLGGLAAHVLELGHCPPGLQPVRFQVDLMRLAALEPLQVEAGDVHAGRRSHIATATVTQDGRTVARATTVFLRPDGEPDGRFWTAADSMPPPPGAPPGAGDLSVHMVPFNESGQIDGGLGAWRAPVRRFAWLRENRALVDDRPLTPFVRAALAADVVSPMLNWSTEGLAFINTDYTLHLARLPVGPAVGIAAGGRHSAEGISVSYAQMHDERGPFGMCSATALANAARFTMRRDR